MASFALFPRCLSYSGQPKADRKRAVEDYLRRNLIGQGLGFSDVTFNEEALTEDIVQPGIELKYEAAPWRRI
jgi:hypothetical protein